MKSLTPEEVKKFTKMGFKLITTYYQTCDLCGKKFKSKDENYVQKRFEKHMDEQCPVAKWMHSASKILEIAGLKNVIQADLLYLMEGEFPDGCERTSVEELRILDDVKNMFDNWGKEEDVE